MKLKFSRLNFVIASKALYDISLSYGMPFVSGKDSMKNDFIGKLNDNETVKISVPPTLLVTAMGRVRSLSHIVTSEIKAAGDFVYVIGDDVTNYQSAFELMEAYDDYQVEYPLPALKTNKQVELYRLFHQAMKEKLIESSHDVSDGGLLLSVAEKMMGTSYGIHCEFNISEKDILGFLFNESAGRIVVSVKKSHEEKFIHLFPKEKIQKIGVTTNDGMLKIISGEKEIVSISGKDCLSQYKTMFGGAV